jgi:hypothetical protein
MNISLAEILTTSLAVVGGIALAAACGLRVFVPMLVLSIASKAGIVSLGGGFQWIASTPAIISFAVASGIEITAYYWPWLDHALDVIAVPCSVTAGTLAVASQVTGMDPWMTWMVGIVAGGGAAGLVQTGTILLRGLSLATTGGFGNPIVSTIENVGAVLVAALAILVPIVALLLLGVVLFMVLYTLRKRRQARAARVSPTLVAAV